VNVVALAGGVGGAKLADGLAGATAPSDLTVIVNTGDDFDHLGLRICPDLDTVVYTLAGIANPETGWGRADDTWDFLQTLEGLGGPTWFRLGDRDLALHHARTLRLRSGEPLSAVTADLATRLGVRARVLPMADRPVATRVLTDQGELSFQDYFVARRCEPAVRGFRFEGADDAEPPAAALAALGRAEVVVVCPSNPWVSIGPILAVPGYRAALAGRRVFAISPIVAGSAVKGPAAKMFAEMGIEPSALAVAEYYRDWATDFVLDAADAALRPGAEALGLRAWVAMTIMRSRSDRIHLARQVLEWARVGTAEGARS
jgi:LPPG:FO 2-phospho-L-lactate transferase